MLYLMFIIGVIVGSVITQIIVRYKTSYGYFSLKEVNDDAYEIHISVNQNGLLDKKKIVLKKDSSQN